MTKWSLFQFRDGRKIKILILSRDINGFSPSCAEDIPDREYLVKWQDSFHDSESGIHHDGLYPGRILLVGATIKEIRAKAKEMKIRLAMTFPSEEEDDRELSVSMKKPLTKSRRKVSDGEEPEVAARKRRMRESAQQLKAASAPSESGSSEGEENLSKSISSKDFKVGRSDISPHNSESSISKRSEGSKRRHQSQQESILTPKDSGSSRKKEENPAKKLVFEFKHSELGSDSSDTL